VLVVVLAGSLVVAAAAHLKVAAALLSRGRTRAEPFQVFARDAAALVPLVALALLLGFWPAPLLSEIASGVRDAAASVEAPVSP
jgi:hypothetical protein